MSIVSGLFLSLTKPGNQFNVRLMLVYIMIMMNQITDQYLRSV